MICQQTKAECAHNCSAWMISCKEAGKPPPPTLAELVSMREDDSLVIDPSVTSFSAQPSSDGWTMEQVSLSNGDIVECGPLVGKTLVDVPGDAAPFVMRDLTKPTLAEIERLVDAYGNARATLLYDGYDYGTAQGTKAALMAAIRLYVQE